MAEFACKVCGGDLGWDRPSGVCSEVCIRRLQGFALTLPERIEAFVREWPQWSPAERRRMDEVVKEILDHCRNGQGNAFVREWCLRNIRFATGPDGYTALHVKRNGKWGLLPC